MHISIWIWVKRPGIQHRWWQYNCKNSPSWKVKSLDCRLFNIKQENYVVLCFSLQPTVLYNFNTSFNTLSCYKKYKQWYSRPRNGNRKETDLLYRYTKYLFVIPVSTTRYSIMLRAIRNPETEAKNMNKFIKWSFSSI